MARANRDAPLAGGGMRLWARFTLLMTLALAGVMAVAGFLLYKSAARVAQSVQEQTLVEAVQLTYENTRRELEAERLRGAREAYNAIAERLGALPEPTPDQLMQREDARAQRDQLGREIEALKLGITWQQDGTRVDELIEGRVRRAPIKIGAEQRPGMLYMRYQGDKRVFDLLAPAKVEEAQRGLLGLILGMSVMVIVVGAAVSVFVANQVSGPLEDIVVDIRQISTGDLRHKTHARGGGEIALLAKSIDRMTHSLAEARETELALSIREREVEVAGEVREALLPSATPTVAGYDVAALHMGSDELGGDFHDFIELADGRLGLLVCDVSGRGLPGALVGATARSYLRAELARGGDLKQALWQVNREVARDVRRGMFVSALYALLDPASHRVTVACAGHKVPLVRWSKADGKLRTVQPEGIALGFDKGPVFERALQLAQLELAPGDRLVLFNTGPVVMVDAAGAEFGEKHLYAAIQKFAARPGHELLDRLRTILENYHGEVSLPRDIAVITLARTSSGP
jgi:serine phosphatase RsbU (regulator of sigma subunit)